MIVARVVEPAAKLARLWQLDHGFGNFASRWDR
jgi:hypothetical protein